MKSVKTRVFLILALAFITVLISVFTWYLYNGELKSVFLNISSKNKLNSMLSEENSLVILNPVSTSIAVDNPIISIEGYCLPSKTLSVNGNEISVNSDGSFLYEYYLETGDNTLNITNGDLNFTYKVKYELIIIKSYSPQSEMTLNGGMMLQISAIALSGAKVYAEVGDKRIELVRQDNLDGVFKTYMGEYFIPDYPQDNTKIGKVKICAEFGEYKEEKLSGEITVLKSNKALYTVENGSGEIVFPKINADNTVELLSPKVNHSNGMAAMCTVTKNYAEVVPASTADDRNDPRYSPYLAGTVDYIVGECSFDDQEYYILLSGVKIDKKNVEAFSGYIMPMNTVSSVTSQGSSLCLTMNWKVPFISELKEQSYYVGHASRAFNVKSFTSSYIDFTFKYTNAAQGNISFENSSVVAYTQWLNIGKDGTSTLRVFLKNKGEYCGYKAYYSADNRLVITFKEKPVSGNTLVVIDAGHGGKDSGAVGINGVHESQINLAISDIIKTELEKNGIRVLFTRYDDSFYTLDERQDFARAAGADLFLALHNNSTESSALSGTEVYYYRANSQPFAACVHKSLVKAWQDIYSDNSLMLDKIIPDDGGVRFYPFQVTRIEECPAILVECGYLSNSVECEMLCKRENQVLIGKAVAEGILNYLTK